jgi:hypothetical protein
MADVFLEYVIPVVTASIFTGLVSVSLLQFLSVRRNIRSESEHHLYHRIIRARTELENTDAFTEMAKESPVFAERFKLVSSPQQYYTIVAFLDLLELLFRLHEKKTIDAQLWPRWRELARTLMTIPKFKAVWANTKHVHTKEFIDFIDSIS